MKNIVRLIYAYSSCEKLRDCWQHSYIVCFNWNVHNATSILIFPLSAPDTGRSHVKYFKSHICHIDTMWGDSSDHNSIRSKARSSIPHIDGLVQDCSNSSALAMELQQFYTKPSIFWQFPSNNSILNLLGTSKTFYTDYCKNLCKQHNSHKSACLQGVNISCVWWPELQIMLWIAEKGTFIFPSNPMTPFKKRNEQRFDPPLVTALTLSKVLYHRSKYI